MAKQNNKLLIKNHESQPIGLALFPEVNVTRYNNNYNSGHGRGHGHGHERR
jgi:hypothetical protein